ncbi:MAG: hypothetical protein MJ180_01740 [Candidatus Gastranaerophilales bacterium]|nr:hypothetical protein [Candidatus Gastranaerophilales bacterium]
MKISNISQVNQGNSPSFKASFVGLSEKNLGRQIASGIVDTFNRRILPEIKTTQLQEATQIIQNAGAGSVIAKASDLQDKVNFFILAGGSGSRFRELAQTVGNYNKISLPFKIGEKEDIHMLDFALAKSKSFIGKEGITPIVEELPGGSFSSIVKHYSAGNPIKDTVVCCGDNVFGDSATSLTEFFTKMINNPKKHVALVGVGRTPEEVAKRFGVLKVSGSLNDEFMHLTGFQEKPELEVAKALAVDGQNIANTGLFYLSKKAMTNLMDEISSGINNIKKNESEVFDFANAVKYVHSQAQKWFGVKPEEAAAVKVVKKWEDLGEPQALYSFANAVKKGDFIGDFPQTIQDKIRKSFNQRVHLDAKTPYILFTEQPAVFGHQIQNAKTVDGVKIVV